YLSFQKPMQAIKAARALGIAVAVLHAMVQVISQPWILPQHFREAPTQLRSTLAAQFGHLWISGAVVGQIAELRHQRPQLIQRGLGWQTVIVLARPSRSGA